MSLYIVSRGVPTPLFYEEPCLLPTPPFLLSKPPSPPPLPCHLQPPPLQFFLLSFFLWLNKWSCHSWCVILLNDNMGLHMSSLGMLVPVWHWYVFHAIRHQVCWGLTHSVVFYWYSDLISHHTHTHTQNTQRKIALKGLASMKISDTHFFKTTPPILPTPPLLWEKWEPHPFLKILKT